MENIFFIRMLYVENFKLNIEKVKFLLLLNNNWRKILVKILVVMLIKMWVVKLYLCVDEDINVFCVFLYF